MTLEVVTAAFELAALGWPVMPVKPHAKEPLSLHGVKDATVERKTIRRWFRQWPEANLAIATGLPGPSVLDVDNPVAAGPALDLVRRIDGPIVATPRGPHHYFQGLAQGTISLGYGELRGRGSYVLVPPSIHPSGKQYVWLHAPDGPLPAVPDLLAGARPTAGVGTFDAPDRIPFGGRHDALKDAAVRFLRGGFTDPATLEQMLEAFFHTRCVTTPPPRKHEFRDLARWAAGTQLADRERRAADLEPPEEPETKKAKKTRKTGLEHPPHGDAPLAEHRNYVRTAGGWSDRIDIKRVIRHGIRVVDGLDIELTNGQCIVFGRQDQITTRGHWTRTVIACTSGIADPQPLGDWEATKVYRSLCVLADTPPEQREAEDLEDAVDDMLALAEAIAGHDLETSGGRYDAIARCRARAAWDPRKHDDRQPVVLVDKAGQRYLRAGELRDYLNFRGFGIASDALAGRMSMIGARRLNLAGRESDRPDGRERRTGHMQVYVLRVEVEDDE